MKINYKYILIPATSGILLYILYNIFKSNNNTQQDDMETIKLDEATITIELAKTYKEPLTRGEQNNNWGNIKKNSRNKWQGEIIGLDKTFCTFSEAKYGLRALLYIIWKYYNSYKLTTITGIIKRWSATDQATYIAYVSKVTGIGANEFIDLSNKDNFYNLVRAIVRTEIGKDRLTRPLFNEVIKMILTYK